MATEQNVLRPDVPAWRSQEESGPYRSAMDRAAKLLSRRARPEAELRARLSEAGYDPAVVDDVTVRLRELSLLDDASFARDWLTDRVARRPESPRLLVQRLIDKGIEREIAIQAIADSGIDEAAEATRAAARLARKVIDRPLAEQGPRLVQMIVRRGFSYDAAEEGARAVLPPEGWD